MMSCFYFHLVDANYPPITPTNNETDRLALLKFKSVISSDPLGALNSWNDSTHFCEWHGVSCGSTTGHDTRARVTTLDLRHQKLSGPIAPHIGNLTFLTELLLNNNSLTEKIPPEIGHLRRLQRLYLSNNSLTGEIPSNISSCSALTIFHVGNNEFVGELPRWSNRKLRGYWVYKNYLTGTIPPSFGNFSSLETFAIGGNRLSGEIPESLGRLKNLHTLYLDLNNFTGEVPASIYNLSLLTYLSFGTNNLRGTLPWNLGTLLPNLQNFATYSNQFTGSIPISLSNASNLVTLQLGYNNFSGSVPNMARSRGLDWFLIDHNFLGGGGADDLSFISSLTNATSLENLAIGHNNFGDVFPLQFGNLSSRLRLLRIGGNKISGSIPSGIQNLINMQLFDASRNSLSGSIPTSIGKLQSLESLDLGHNKISGSVPSSIGNLTRLVLLSLESNNLDGEIPASVGNCQDLIFLDLSNNDLSGFIPQHVMELTSLSRLLNLSQNQLAGALPAEVSNLKNLGSLDLSHNMLSGSIPGNLGSCLGLEMVNLRGNLLQGPIPSGLGVLRGIQQFDVSSNNLSGEIPDIFQDMKFLQILNLSYNNLEGEVPQGGMLKNGSIVLVSGNSNLCGGVPELKLPPCNYYFKHLKKKKALSSKWKIVASTISIMLLFTLTSSCLLVIWIRKRRKRGSVSSDDSMLQLSYLRLYKATNGFSTANLIGKGSFGSVYRGVLDQNGSTIAVKVFNLDRRGATKSFVAECEALKNIRHRNLVRILTVCSGVDRQGNDFKALVYEFLANGSLEEWLHPVERADEPPKSLSFRQRMNVAINVASALDYLHHQCEMPIVHCDLKPSNILLDEDKVGHVGDFGLARFLRSSIDNLSSASQTSSTICIKGTIGYAPPGKYSTLDGTNYYKLFQLYDGIQRRTYGAPRIVN
ncbi:unnamed protein product [Linum trigynum]|uniref:non-specific serine/threonine protein kinase n=1 Tax=Linum trigynum TaxID=586398 RepID=A0AAV2CQE3_9ROSI